MAMIVKAKGIYHHGRVEFAKPQEAPPDGTQILIQYEVPQRKSFSGHFGVLSREEGAAMIAEIEQAFEHVDPNEW
jgi:hypothetical protein